MAGSPPALRTPVVLMRAVWARMEEEAVGPRWPAHPALLGFPTATLGGGPDPQETPRLELSLDVQMAGELDHAVLMVLPCFIKCPNKQASQAHSVLFTAAIISLTSRLI